MGWIPTRTKKMDGKFYEHGLPYMTHERNDAITFHDVTISKEDDTLKE